MASIKCLALATLISFFCCVSAFDMAQCEKKARDLALQSKNPTFLTTSTGTSTTNISEAWGITYAACNDICGPGHDPFSWNLFAQTVSAWLIPWLALTAQLPFETKSTFGNLISACLAVGSPMLATYSLSISVLNARWINKRFGELLKKDSELGGHMEKTIERVKSVLISMQHVPLAISQGSDRELTQLIVSPEKRGWWKTLEKELAKTQREWTYSLIAQSFWVTGTQVLAIIVFFTSAVDDSTIGLGLAINSLWIWILPVSLGYVRVGTQTSASSTRKAIVAASGDTGQMYGIRDRSEDRIRYRRVGRQSIHDVALLQLVHHSQNRPSLPMVSGLIVPGCDAEIGPIHNYSRVWTHLYVADNIYNGFYVLLEQINQKISVKGVSGSWESVPGKMDANLTGTTEQIARYIEFLDHDEIPIYSTDTIPGVWTNILISILVGFLMQLVTTGSAFYMAYETPVIGLGCLSGSYLLYGLASLLVWSLMTLSASLSYSCNLRIQQNKASGKPYLFLSILAWSTKHLGTLLAVANTVYVVVISALQFSNLYNNCWCMGCVPGMGAARAWVALFATDAQIAMVAKSAWIWGTFTSIGVAVVAYGFFLFGRGEELFAGNTQ